MLTIAIKKSGKIFLICNWWSENSGNKYKQIYIRFYKYIKKKDGKLRAL